MSRYILARCGAPVPDKNVAHAFVKDEGGDTVGVVYLKSDGNLELKCNGRSYGLFADFSAMCATLSGIAMERDVRW